MFSVSEEEAKYFLNGEDSVDQNKFVEDCWSNVKPYLMMDAGVFKPPINDEAEDMESDADGEDNNDEHLEGKLYCYS